MRFPQIVVLLVAILGTPAAAQQTTNPVAQHYRAYWQLLSAAIWRAQRWRLKRR